MEQILEKIVERLKNESKLIILFGSHAWGTPHAQSDIDLYIVADNQTMPKTWEEKSRLTRPFYKKIYDLQAIYPIDLLVHTEPMFEKFLAYKSSFAKKLFNEGKVLWRAPSLSSGSKRLETTSK